jgi:hypothetical protein
VQKHIDEAYNFYIKPTTEALDEIKRYRPPEQKGAGAGASTGGAAMTINSLEALNVSLRKASVAATRLDNKQKRLQVSHHYHHHPHHDSHLFLYFSCLCNSCVTLFCLTCSD